MIDGTGMTAIAGYIDVHRHLMQGGRGGAGVAQWLQTQAADRMRELLESAVLTVHSGGDDNAGIIEPAITWRRRPSMGHWSPKMRTQACVSR
jgi:hypothetical protein